MQIALFHWCRSDDNVPQRANLPKNPLKMFHRKIVHQKKFPPKILQNFERPFTPRGWLRSASDFGKTRFRRSPTFDFSTSKKKFWRKFSSKIFAGKIFVRKFGKLPILEELWWIGRDRQVRLEK